MCPIFGRGHDFLSIERVLGGGGEGNWYVKMLGGWWMSCRRRMEGVWIYNWTGVVQSQGRGRSLRMRTTCMRVENSTLFVWCHGGGIGWKGI